MSSTAKMELSCPIPLHDYPTVLLAHGGGGKFMHQLINKMFLKVFGNSSNPDQHDSTVLNVNRGRIAYTTDSYVVRPPFFPGGNIGDLAVNGTVNDLAMSGARPLYLSLGMILEEGLPMKDLWQIVQTIKKSAERAHVKIVTGDTKVVDRGKGDGIYLNTSGIGVIEHNLEIKPSAVQPEDAILLNGDLGQHGMAVMAQREGLEFESPITSDTAPLHDLVLALLSAGIHVHCLRDLTRGGLASAINEIAQASGWGIHIDEAKIPVREDVRGACEILGLDPLYVANEGRFIAFIPKREVSKALSLLREDPLGKGSQWIGEVTEKKESIVTLASLIGTRRILDMLSGEQLPRIC